MKLALMPGMSSWRAEVKRAERAARLAFEVDKAHHFALVEYSKTGGVGSKKFEAQRTLASAEYRKRAAEQKAQRILWLESKRRVLAEKERAEWARDMTRWAFRKGPRIEVRTGVALPVVSILRIYAEVAECR